MVKLKVIGNSIPRIDALVTRKSGIRPDGAYRRDVKRLCYNHELELVIVMIL